MSEPRVLIAHPFPDVYGADRVVLESAVGLLGAGFFPSFVLPEPGPMTRWLDARGIPHRCEDVPVIRRALMKPAPAAALAIRTPSHLSHVARVIADIAPDLLYVNTVTLPHWVLGARRARIPVIVHAHESDARMGKFISKSLLAPVLAANSVIAVSQAAKTFLSNAYSRLAGRTTVIYNGVEAPSREFSAPHFGNPVRLAVIGRLNPNKGQDLAIEAVAHLTRRGHDVRLEIIGDVFPGYEKVADELHKSVRERGLEARVTFAGFCRDVWQILDRTDIVLAPSRTDSLPLVVIEAMLAGRPVIAARVGGIPELLDDGRTGLLVPPENPIALSEMVEHLIDRPTVARNLGALGRATALKRFAPSRYRNDIATVANRVLFEG